MESLKLQIWQELRALKLRRYSICEKVCVKELIDNHEMEGYVFKIEIDGTGPYILKVICYHHGS